MLRGFRYSLDPLFVNAVPGDIIGSLTVGAFPKWDEGAGAWLSRGSPVLGFESFNMGQEMPRIQPCYALAGQGQWIALLLTFSAAYKAASGGSTDNVSLDLIVELYGNLLRKTGRPLEQEVGSMPIFPGAPVNPSGQVVGAVGIPPPETPAGLIDRRPLRVSPEPERSPVLARARRRALFNRGR